MVERCGKNILGEANISEHFCFMIVILSFTFPIVLTKFAKELPDLSAQSCDGGLTHSTATLLGKP